VTLTKIDPKQWKDHSIPSKAGSQQWPQWIFVSTPQLCTTINSIFRCSNNSKTNLVSESSIFLWNEDTFSALVYFHIIHHTVACTNHSKNIHKWQQRLPSMFPSWDNRGMWLPQNQWFDGHSKATYLIIRVVKKKCSSNYVYSREHMWPW
jgi:hypothetical protein